MGKAIAEMTPQELQKYDPAKNLHRSLNPDRWEKAWQVVPQLVTLLKQNFGASRVVVFGSLTNCDSYTQWSDIDLAAWDILPSNFTLPSSPSMTSARRLKLIWLTRNAVDQPRFNKQFSKRESTFEPAVSQTATTDHSGISRH